MCDKAVNTSLSTIKFGPEYFIVQEMSNKAVNIYSFLYLFQFLSHIKLKKCMIELLRKILFYSILPSM